MVESSRIKGSFNAWAVKVLKGHNRSSRRLYHVNDIDRGYRLIMTRRSNMRALKDKSNIPRAPKAKM